jgi:hypothetical protein
MTVHKVAMFRPYPFQTGQKIHIGDWEVIGVSDRKVELRCPVSLREFEWNRFCYFMEDREINQWPQED